MTRLLIVASAILHVVLPLGLAAWTGFSTPTSRVHLLAKAALAVSLAGVLWTGGSGWHVVGTLLRPFVAGAVLVGTAASFRWWTTLPWWPESIWPAGLATGAWTILGAGLAYSWGLMLAGARPPDGERVDLAFPLRGGRFYVVWGGSHPAMNRHLRILESEKREKYRGQAYAQDIVAVDAFGLRAGGLLPTDLESYEIFGARVVAPCAGRVARAVGDRPDVTPPEPDDGPPAGNHVLLSCGDYQVLLAHLKKESLEVEQGDDVDVGETLGRVGNSGNTSEPHLHVHAQRAAEGGEWMSGQPLVATFDGEFPAKGSIIEN